MYENMNKIEQVIFDVLSMGLVLFYSYSAVVAPASTQFHRGIYVIITYILIFLAYKSKSKIMRVVDYLLILASIVTIGYWIVNFQAINYRTGAETELDTVIAVIGVLVGVELARRVVGNVFVILGGLMLLYGVYGEYMPDLLSHAGDTFPSLCVSIFYKSDGVFGIMANVLATYVILFVLFGAYLEASGAQKFFIDWPLAAVGHRVGGPAKVSVIASGLFGSISGSAIANTVSTGAFTIPMMKKSGFPPHVAGGIEPAASIGGMFMPPIMGAGGFIMAELTGVPYSKIMLVAIFPAIMYFFSVFCMVHYFAKGRNIVGDRSEHSAMYILRNEWIYILPLVVITIFMLTGFSPGYSAILGLATCVAVSHKLKETRIDLTIVAIMAVVLIGGWVGAGLNHISEDALKIQTRVNNATLSLDTDGETPMLRTAVRDASTDDLALPLADYATVGALAEAIKATGYYKVELLADAGKPLDAAQLNPVGKKYIHKDAFALSAGQAADETQLLALKYIGRKTTLTIVTAGDNPMLTTKVEGLPEAGLSFSLAEYTNLDQLAKAINMAEGYKVKVLASRRDELDTRQMLAVTDLDIRSGELTVGVDGYVREATVAPLLKMLKQSLLVVYGFIFGAVLLFIRHRRGADVKAELKRFALAARAGTLQSLKIGATVGVIGIIIGVLTYSGLVLTFADIVIELASRVSESANVQLFMTILFIAIASLVLGMGVPVTAAYLITAVVAVPALTHLNVNPIAAHMIVYWLSQDSNITPPVCIAAFAGATIAEANMWKTAFTSFKFAKFLYLGPFLFGYVPAFSLDGSASDIVIAFTLILLGTWGYSFLLSGYWIKFFRKNASPA